MLKKGRFVLGVVIVMMIILAVKCEETLSFHTEKRKENFGRAAKIIMERADAVIPMPQIVDIVIENDKCTALCEDGSVWEWEDLYEKRNLRKVNNLNFIVKIFDAGPAMYALSEDGHIYAWGSNEWGQISTEDRDAYFEDAIQLFGLSNIVDMDVSLDMDSEKGKGFCIDGAGNFYEWGLYVYFEETKDCEPDFPKQNVDLVKGVQQLYAGTGNYNYFVREDGSVFSIMETTLWENTRDFIFPSLPIEENQFNVNAAPLTENEVSYTILNQGTKYGMTILYELGEEEGIEKIASDPYTVFLYKEDGSLWYWNSGTVKYHDNKVAMANPEIYGEDYQGGFEAVDLKSILEMDGEDDVPEIVDMCAGSENILFLADNGEVFISEYVTKEIGDVEYYYLKSTNPNSDKTGWIKDFPFKTINFYKLDWENIVSINTNGEYCFSAVDKKGDYFYLDMDSEKENKEASFIPQIVDVIIENDNCTALCEDGSVWEGIYEKRNLHKMPNLNFVVKILDAGEAMYALSINGDVYAWGSNAGHQIDAEEDSGTMFYEPVKYISGISDMEAKNGSQFAISQDGKF